MSACWTTCLPRFMERTRSARQRTVRSRSASSSSAARLRARKRSRDRPGGNGWCCPSRLKRAPAIDVCHSPLFGCQYWWYGAVARHDRQRKTSIGKIVVASSQAIYGEGKVPLAGHGSSFLLGAAQSAWSQAIFSVLCRPAVGPQNWSPLMKMLPARQVLSMALPKLTQEQMVLSSARRWAFRPLRSAIRMSMGRGNLFPTPIRNPFDLLDAHPQWKPDQHFRGWQGEPGFRLYR